MVSCRHCGGKGIDDRLQLVMLELERGLVNDQARADIAHVFDGHQIVGLERAAGRNQINDAIGQTDQRGQFH